MSEDAEAMFKIRPCRPHLHADFLVLRLDLSCSYSESQPRRQLVMLEHLNHGKKDDSG